MSPNLKSALEAAPSLLGFELIHTVDGVDIGGIIVETEAYDMHDPASHAYGGERIRNASLYKEAGTIYVYLIYGIHYCVNIVTGNKGHGQGVLIRALEPTIGLEAMKANRGTKALKNLTNGPGKLTQALGIGPGLNGRHIGNSSLRLGDKHPVADITQTTRIGITKAADLPWRFYVTSSPFVSSRVSV